MAGQYPSNTESLTLAMKRIELPNIAVKVAPSGRWTLRDKAPRSAPYLQRYAAALRLRRDIHIDEE